MALTNKINKKTVLLAFFCAFALTACSISYSFTGASIDYSRIRTISIADFPNVAPLVHPPLSNMFTEALRDQFSRRTRLQLLRTGGDLDIQGEIVGYDYVPLAIATDGFGTQTRLTLTVNVRFENRTNPEEDFERRFSASYTFDADRMLADIQDQLLDTMIQQIVEQIFNDTVARW